MVVEIFNANVRTVTYSVEQLKRGCVDETSMRACTSTSLRRMTMAFGSTDCNELNRYLSWLSWDQF